MVLNKKKKCLGFILTLGIMMLITGCGNKTPDAQSLMTTSYTNLKNQSSMEIKLTYILDATLDSNDKQIPFKVESNMITQSASETDITHSEGIYNISVSDITESIKINTYTSKTETTTTTYAQNSSSSDWTYLEQNFNAEKDDFNPFKIISNHQDVFVVNEMITTYNDRECYEIKGTASGDILKEILTGVLSSNKLIESLEEIDLTNTTAEVVFLVYKNEALPASLTINFTNGLQPIVNNELEKLNKDSELPLKANINNFTITISYEKYGTCNDLIIPTDIIKIAEEYTEANENWSSFDETITKPSNNETPEISNNNKDEEKDIYDDTPDGNVAADSNDDKIELDKTSSEIGLDWRNFEFNYNNVTMYLPTSYITFKTYTNYQIANPDDELEAGKTVKCNAKMGTNTLSITIKNTTEETKKISDCTVIAIYFDSYSLNEKELAKIIFAGNITMSSVKDDVIAAYGEPISISSSSMLDIYEYKMSEESTSAVIKIYIDKENGSVVEYRIINN